MKKNIVLFLILGIIVFVIEFTLFESALKIGFKPDDWALYFGYKSLGVNSLLKIAEVWHERGAYTTYQVYYIGLLDYLAGGLNFFSFQLINLIFKSLGTLMIFPLILVIFKSRILAIFTALIYAVSFSSLGPLEFAVKGSDYLAIFFMCLFFITYYYIIKKPKNFPLLLLGLMLLILTINLSPIRLYPLLVLFLLIEGYLYLQKRTKEAFKNVLKRTGMLLSPFIFIVIYSPAAIAGFLGTPAAIYNGVIKGDSHLVLSTLAGIGGTFITEEYWRRIFGSLMAENFGEYLFFLAGGPAVIFGVLTAIISFAACRKPLVFFIKTFIPTLLFSIPLFFFLDNPSFDRNAFYPSMFGIYILVLSFACFMEWRKERNDNLLFGIWGGCLFLFVFSLMIWLFAPYGTFFSPTGYYLVVASIGSALVLASIPLLIYKRIAALKNRYIGKSAFLPALIIIAVFFRMSIFEIDKRFSYLLANGRSAQGQQMIQGIFRNKVSNKDLSKPTLFYFDTSDLNGDGPFYSEGFLESLKFFMRFEGSKLTEGCSEVVYSNDHKDLNKLVKEANGQKGLFYRSLCMEGENGFYRDVIYSPENFHAFKIKNRNFIDIRQEVLQELHFE